MDNTFTKEELEIIDDLLNIAMGETSLSDDEKNVHKKVKRMIEEQ
jgi:uncharacterized protein YgfB (UPF0149 family)